MCIAVTGAAVLHKVRGFHIVVFIVEGFVDSFINTILLSIKRWAKVLILIFIWLVELLALIFIYLDILVLFLRWSSGVLAFEVDCWFHALPSLIKIHFNKVRLWLIRVFLGLFERVGDVRCLILIKALHTSLLFHWKILVWRWFQGVGVVALGFTLLVILRSVNTFVILGLGEITLAWLTLLSICILIQMIFLSLETIVPSWKGGGLLMEDVLDHCWLSSLASLGCLRLFLYFDIIVLIDSFRPTWNKIITVWRLKREWLYNLLLLNHILLCHNELAVEAWFFLLVRIDQVLGGYVGIIYFGRCGDLLHLYMRLSSSCSKMSGSVTHGVWISIRLISLLEDLNVVGLIGLVSLNEFLVLCKLLLLG